MIISNNLRVYNTRVRSDCKSKKVILKNSRFSLSNRRACITAWKRLESCIAENFRASYFWGNRRTNILFNLLAKYMDSHAKGNGIALNVRVCGA